MVPPIFLLFIKNYLIKIEKKNIKMFIFKILENI